MKGRECGAAAVRIISNIVDIIVLIAVLLGIFIACYSIWDSRQMESEASPSRYTAYMPTGESSLSFGQLRKINPEVIAWIDIYGTTINYPVTHTSNNTKYVNTDAKGKYNMLGSIYLDYRNKDDFSDYANVLYGHHMSPSIMFGDIGSFEDKEFFKEHRYGNLYCDGKNKGLEFFAFFKGDAYTSFAYDISAAKQDRDSYLQAIRKNAVNLRKINVNASDRLVVCSTCSNEDTNGRFILVGRITDKTYKDTFKDDTTYEGNSLWKDKTWLLIVSAVILILIVLLIIFCLRRKKKRQEDENDDTA